MGRKRKQAESEYDDTGILLSSDEDVEPSHKLSKISAANATKSKILKELVSELTMLQSELQSLREEHIITPDTPPKKIGKKRGRKLGQKAKPKFISVDEKKTAKRKFVAIGSSSSFRSSFHYFGKMS